MVQRAADEVTDFCFDWFKRQTLGRKLILVGSNGCGKTTLANRGHQWMQVVHIEAFFKNWKGCHAPSSVMIRWQRICDELATEKNFTFLDELVEDASCLFVDDIGAEADRFKNQHNTDALCYLLSLCQGKTWLFITTNELPQNWAKRWDNRTDDRFLRDSTIVDMSQVPSWTKLQ